MEDSKVNELLEQFLNVNPFLESIGVQPFLPYPYYTEDDDLLPSFGYQFFGNGKKPQVDINGVTHNVLEIVKEEGYGRWVVVISNAITRSCQTVPMVIFLQDPFYPNSHNSKQNALRLKEFLDPNNYEKYFKNNKQ